MPKLNRDVKELLNDAKIWIIATMDESPNAIPILFKKITDEDDLILFDVFMNQSIKNIKKNAQIAISAYDVNTLTGYQLKGTAQYSTDRALVEEGNSITKNYNLTTKGAVIVNIDKVIVLSPGPDNGKVL